MYEGRWNQDRLLAASKGGAWVSAMRIRFNAAGLMLRGSTSMKKNAQIPRQANRCKPHAAVHTVMVPRAMLVQTQQPTCPDWSPSEDHDAAPRFNGDAGTKAIGWGEEWIFVLMTYVHFRAIQGWHISIASDKEQYNILISEAVIRFVQRG